MKRALLVLAAVFSLFTLVESTHAHQFLHDDCCQSMCCGAMVVNRGADSDAQITPPQQPLVRSLPVEPLPASGLFEADIFHPPLFS